MALAYVLDDVFVRHRPPGPHPERPERLLAARDGLRAAGLEQRGRLLPVRAAREEELGRVHTAGYLADLARELPGKSGWLDADTYFGPETWDAALAAAAAAIDLATRVLAGEFDRGLALVRPPGHHAPADRAMGFCVFNNAAAAAAAARAEGAARVAVVDWDVHHGNGTQDIFYADPSVMYLSVHQYPFYPGTGGPGEIGEGAGRGATVNVGLPAGCGDADVMAAFDRVFVPALMSFRPDLILVSAGFDAHRADPLAGLRMTDGGYRAIAARLAWVADQVAGGRLVALLEGGYDLGALSRSLVEVLDVLDRRPAGSSRDEAPIESEASREGLAAVARTLAAHAGQPWADASADEPGEKAAWRA
jgi:acetoin utilization deacetylase AcuC-like enzyme